MTLGSIFAECRNNTIKMEGRVRGVNVEDESPYRS